MVQYTNAKVLIVGDKGAGKTALAYRLATGKWKPSDGSTVGAWSTQWKIKSQASEKRCEREIWLWDFGGQADQRLVHQLYMEHSALIVILFDPDKEDALAGLVEWQATLNRCIPSDTPRFLVAGRIETGFKINRQALDAFVAENHFTYFETSARENKNCLELRDAIVAKIPWPQGQPTRTQVFIRIKNEILKLRRTEWVLPTFKELREELRKRLPTACSFMDEELRTAINLLDGPGIVKELDYGSYILLQPEWINAYAQAVIRTLRQDPFEMGCIPLCSVAEGKLLFQMIDPNGGIEEMKRLPGDQERIVLREMERQLEDLALCLRQGNKLVFPSYCGRDRPAVQKYPSVVVTYKVQGYLDAIYSTLVVKLVDSEAFKLKELWRDAADFDTLVDGHRMGIKLMRESATSGEISVYFSPKVSMNDQVVFANYIHAHLQIPNDPIHRIRHYVCPYCGEEKGKSEALMKKLLVKKRAADTECDNHECGKRFPLWDALEKMFASEAVRTQVEELQADDLANLTTRRKGKLLVLDVGARITGANQKWMEVPGDEDDGIDIQVEFTDDAGNGVGKGLCLQLKAGNTFLKKRKTDGIEVFAVKKQRWVKTWMNQPYPVMLVIGTFSDQNERAVGKEKVEFAEVRWMEISSVLKRESANGTKPVRQIKFKGERLDLASVLRWRGKMMAE